MAGNLNHLASRAVGVLCVGKLLVAYLLGEDVADVGLNLPVRAKLLRDGEVEHIAGHLVAVGHAGVVLAAGAALAASHTDDALAYAVVEQRYGELLLVVLIEKAGVDKVGRLSLHGAVFISRPCGKVYP